MKLTEHFTLEEMTVTNTGLDNIPGSIEMKNLMATAQKAEEIRVVLDSKPMITSSGYRSVYVNKKAGGASTSDHLRGLAQDFVCPEFGTPYAVCKKISASGVKYDQLIHECGYWSKGEWINSPWVHVGNGAGQRQQDLTIDKFGTRSGIHEARK